MGARNGFRVERASPDRHTLLDTLLWRCIAKEERDIGRLRQVLEFVTHDRCLTRRLLANFSEELADCGHCGRCEGLRARPPPPVPSLALSRAQSALVASLIAREADPSPELVPWPLDVVVRADDVVAIVERYGDR